MKGIWIQVDDGGKFDKYNDIAKKLTKKKFDFVILDNKGTIRNFMEMGHLFKEAGFKTFTNVPVFEGLNPDKKDDVNLAYWKVCQRVHNSFDGIVLDYIRYTDSYRFLNALKSYKITRFVKKIKETFPKKLIALSTKCEDYSSMWGLWKTSAYYGQNYPCLARYADIFMPMAYIQCYKVQEFDIYNIVKWIKQMTKKKVMPILQAY